MAHRLIHRPRRRTFLGLTAAGLVASTLGPTIWARRSRADTPGFGAVKHLFLVSADGGMRSTCLFNADVGEQWNPAAISGKQTGASGTDWGVGGVFDAAAADGGGIVDDIPSLPQISDQICVLGTVDHTPGEERGDGNHATAQLRMATGAPDGTVGLLTRVYRHHALYQGAGVEENLPPVIVGSARLYGVGSGEWGPFRPVVVGGHRDFGGGGGSDSAAQPGWALAMERGADDWFAASRAARHRSMVNGLIDSKRQAVTFRPIFTDPILDVVGQPGEAMHGMTNEELLATLGDSDLARDVALGLRFCGFGAPAVVVGEGGWDFHSDELTEFPAYGQRLGRVLSGLYRALKTLQHPEGGTYFDHSLVAVVSEFGRDNTDLTGFNSGNGSDHVGTAANRYQALPFFGKVVGQKGGFFGATNATSMEPKSGEPVFSSISVLATFLDVLGIDPEPHFPDEPMTAIF